MTTAIAYAATNNAAVAGANNLQKSSVTNGAGDGSLSAVTSYTYNAFGDLRTVVGPLGAVQSTRDRRDNNRQLSGRVEVDPDGASTGRPSRATRYTYNGDGQPTLIEHGTVASQSDADWLAFVTADQQAIAYDTVGRKVSESLAGGGVTQALTQYSYDAANRTDCVAQRMNASLFSSPPSPCAQGTAGSYGPDRITETNYDAANRVVSTTRGLGTAAQFNDGVTTYTLNGLVQTVTDGDGHLTTYSYDGFDHRVKTQFPSPSNGAVSSTTDYLQSTFDPSTWNLTQERRRDGQVVNYSYDARHRLTAKDAPASTYAYDNLDRQVSATQGGQTLTTAYDALGRITSATGPLGTVAYQYDLAGNRIRTTWPDAFYVTYDRDYTGAMTAIRENGATSGAGVLATYAYDNLGRASTLTRGNGVVTTYGYDPVSRLSSLAMDLSGTANDQTLSFGYNPASQLAGRTSNNATYAWAGLVNVSRGYTINGLNQISAISTPVTPTYDGRGNLTADGVTTYSYDIDNRLTGASGGVTLAYDPQARLYQTVSSGGSVTRFAYDGDDLIGEFNGSNLLQRRYVHGPGDDQPLVWYEGSGTTDRRWLIADQQGSIVAVTNGSGVSTATNTYDEYGIPGSSNLGRFQYTGQIWIPEVGVYHYKARAYPPTLGRFLQTDPIGYADNLNMYAYVGNDPVNGADPSGMDAGAPDISPSNLIDGIEVQGKRIIRGVGFTAVFSGIEWGGRLVSILDLPLDVAQLVLQPTRLGNQTLTQTKVDEKIRKLINKSTPGKRGGKNVSSNDVNGGGGKKAAMDDFKDLGATAVQVYKNGDAVVGTLEDGTSANVHFSKQNGWSLEFNRPDGTQVKLRY